MGVGTAGDACGIGAVLAGAPFMGAVLAGAVFMGAVFMGDGGAAPPAGGLAAGDSGRVATRSSFCCGQGNSSLCGPATAAGCPGDGCPVDACPLDGIAAGGWRLTCESAGDDSGILVDGFGAASAVATESAAAGLVSLAGPAGFMS
jgi:hypothetical protein